MAAVAADHASIHRLLRGVFQAPSATEFQTQLEAPDYNASDRLLIRSGEQPVAHLRTVFSDMVFGRVQSAGKPLPAGELVDLATLPEYRGRGYATALVDAAERRLAQQGAVIALVRTHVPRLFARRGWSVCGRYCCSTAEPRAVLSQLQEAQAARDACTRFAQAEHSCLNVRLWRHFEQAGLMRLYEENLTQAWGSPRRSEAAWRWLIDRRGFDRIYVAVSGDGRMELDEQQHRMAGYAVMREGRIVELTTRPDQPQAAIELLARACSDAIERDFHQVRLDAPPAHPLHRVLLAANGQFLHQEADRGQVQMAKVLNRRGLASWYGPLLHQRAKAAGLPRPTRLGLKVGSEQRQILLKARSANLTSGSPGRNWIACRTADLLPLLMGHLNVAEAVEAGRFSASGLSAVELAAALLPQQPWWRPPLDYLPSLGAEL